MIEQREESMASVTSGGADIALHTPVTAGDNELGVARQTAQASQEVQAAVFLAKKFPRNENACFAQIIRACQRFTFADRAEYAYPRGGQEVRGGSVYLAREMARVWGNILYGARIIAEDEDKIVGEAFAWDLQTNARASAEFRVPRLQQRKNPKTKVTEWVRPDERDLRELFNNIAARNYRNCIFSLMPSDYIDEAVQQSQRTVSAGVASDPDKAKKDIIVAFGQINVSPEMLEEFLGHALDQTSTEQIARLRAIYRGIRDGSAKWQDFAKKEEKMQASVDPNAVRVSADKNRGHDGVRPESAQSTETTPAAESTPNPETVKEEPRTEPAPPPAAQAGPEKPKFGQFKR